MNLRRLTAVSRENPSWSMLPLSGSYTSNRPFASRRCVQINFSSQILSLSEGSVYGAPSSMCQKRSSWRSVISEQVKVHDTTDDVRGFWIPKGPMMIYSSFVFWPIGWFLHSLIWPTQNSSQKITPLSKISIFPGTWKDGSAKVIVWGVFKLC